MKPTAVTPPPGGGAASQHRDRRDSRWDEHRRARREQLVAATVAAVGEHGPGVGISEIAATAGTSKTVLYRHFADRDDLHRAVSTQVAERLLEVLRTALSTTDEPRHMVAVAIDTYLAFIEADPELYRFVVHAPTGDTGADPIAGLSELVGEQATALVAMALEGAGRPTAAAEPWGHGLVGLVRSAADRWLGSPDPMPRAELTAHLTDLAWAGLSGVVTGPRTPSTTEENR